MTNRNYYAHPLAETITSQVPHVYGDVTKGVRVTAGDPPGTVGHGSAGTKKDQIEINLDGLFTTPQPEYHGEFEDMTDEQKDAVISPAYYKGLIGNLEYLGVMEHLLTEEEFQGLIKGLLYKYMFRAGKKDALPQDVGKIDWYSAYWAEYLKRKKERPKP